MRKYFKFDHSFFGDFYIDTDKDRVESNYAEAFRGDDIECALKWEANQLISRDHFGDAGDWTSYNIHVIDEKFGYVLEEKPKGDNVKHYICWCFPANHFSIEEQIKTRDPEFLKLMVSAIKTGNKNVRLSKRTGLPIFDIAFPRFMREGDIDSWVGSCPYLSEDIEIAKFQMNYAGLIN